MITDYIYLFAGLGLLSLLCSGVISWIVYMYVERILHRSDLKINQEAQRLWIIDGFEIDWIDVPSIRDRICKKEAVHLFLLIFSGSLISLIAGAIFVLTSPTVP